MIIQPPKTLEDFLEIRKTIESLMDNKFADRVMIDNLKVRLAKVNEQIDKLK